MSSSSQDTATVTVTATATILSSVLCLKGHQGTVLCLDHGSYDHNLPITTPSQEEDEYHNGGSGYNNNNNLLLSGSEDGTARLWDWRTSSKAICCIVAGEQVTSVRFGPPDTSWLQLSSNNDRLFAKPYTVYLSAGSQVLAVDLRMATSPILSLDHCNNSNMAKPKQQQQQHQTELLQAKDDINQIDIQYCSSHEQRRQQHQQQSKLFLAAADDSGVVQVREEVTAKKGGSTTTTSTSTSTTKTLVHGEDALVTAAVFRPRSSTNKAVVELASGGTDCRVCLWDVNKPK
jgi:WD40 repeat protein